MSKRTRWIIISLAAVIVAALALWPTVSRRMSAGKAGAAQTVPAPARDRQLNVNALVVRPRTMSDRVTVPGNILPAEEVDLSFETSGKVEDVCFNEGEPVAKGTLLAKINDRPLQAQLRKLEAQVPLAKDRVYRSQTLLEKDAVSREAHEAVETEYEKLMADIELVKANIAQTELRAPFDGVVGLRELSEGAFASPQTSVVRLSQVSNLKIDFAIPESYASEIGPGTPIRFSLTDADGRMNSYTAEVYAVESRIDLSTRTLRVRALYPNQRTRLVPGRFASVEIGRRVENDALAVPSESLIPEMGRTYVYLYRSGTAQPAEVTTGMRTEADVQILSGLQPGDTVLTSGVMQLRTGTKVTLDRID